MSSTTPDQTETPASNQPELSPTPIEEVGPTLPESGLWPETVALGRYMARTEVHTYAFSVAAQVILSLFPFIVLLLTLSRNVFHSRSMEEVVGDMVIHL